MTAELERIRSAGRDWARANPLPERKRNRLRILAEPRERSKAA